MRGTLIVYDFETAPGDTIDPRFDQPTQLAALAFHGGTLDEKPGSEFNSFIRPEDFSKISDKSIEFHMKVRGVGREEILKIWHAAPPLEVVVGSFKQYLSQFNWKKSKFTAPVAAGHNIRRYDNVIWERLATQFKLKDSEGFHPRDSVDLLDLAFSWFENAQKPEKYNLDALREYFGLSTKDGHDALKDVRDTGQLIVRFLRLHRSIAPKVKFAAVA